MKSEERESQRAPQDPKDMQLTENFTKAGAAERLSRLGTALGTEAAAKPP